MKFNSGFKGLMINNFSFFFFPSNKRLDTVSAASISEYVWANFAKETLFSSIYENSHFLAEQTVKNKHETQKTLLVFW